MTPVVSVVIPTFNRAHLVGQAIDSALNQTDPHAEVIVVDDGSTDDTKAVVRRYGDRVLYVKTSHGGVAHARNVGMRHARGRYLTFLDSDDLLYPYALELQSRLLDRFPDAALVCAEMSGFDDEGFFERYHLQKYHHSAYRDPSVNYDSIFESSLPLVDAVRLPGELLRLDPGVVSRKVYFGNVFDTYLLNLVLCQNSVMLRSDVVAAVGERRVRVKHWQEVDYLLTITRRHAVCFADVPTYQLRYHHGQVSSHFGPEGHHVWVRKQQILLRVVKRHALADPDYYRRHRSRIERYLAHLHRAVAVPMLIHDGTAAIGRRYTQYARRHLARCAAYGHPSRALLMAAFAPAPLRRVAVRVIEAIRKTRLKVSSMTAPSRRAGSPPTLAA